jgi:hypothetical protein
MTIIRNIFGSGLLALTLITAPVLAAENTTPAGGDNYPRCSKTVTDHCTNAEGKSAHMGAHHSSRGHMQGKHHGGHHRKHRHSA